MLEELVISRARRLLQQRDGQRIVTVRFLSAALAVDAGAFQGQIDIEAQRIKCLAVQLVDLFFQILQGDAADAAERAGKVFFYDGRINADCLKHF